MASYYFLLVKIKTPPWLSWLGDNLKSKSVNTKLKEWMGLTQLSKLSYVDFDALIDIFLSYIWSIYLMSGSLFCLYLVHNVIHIPAASFTLFQSVTVGGDNAPKKTQKSAER